MKNSGHLKIVYDYFKSLSPRELQNKEHREFFNASS